MQKSGRCPTLQDIFSYRDVPILVLIKCLSFKFDICIKCNVEICNYRTSTKIKMHYLLWIDFYQLASCSIYLKFDCCKEWYPQCDDLHLYVDIMINQTSQ